MKRKDSNCVGILSDQGEAATASNFREYKAQFIRRAAAVPNQIGGIKSASSTVAARRMNRA